MRWIEDHDYIKCPKCGVMVKRDFTFFDAMSAQVQITDDLKWLVNFAAHSKIQRLIADTPTVDAVPVVRCKDCINAEPLERNCEVNANFYMHCRLWRGEECKNVWHKYKRYYRDYSLVQHDDFCSSGERKDGAEC